MNKEPHFDINRIAAYLEQFQEDSIAVTRTDMETLIPDAVQVLRDILRSSSAKPEQKLRAARYIIDMSPLGKEIAQARAPHIVTALIQNLSPEQILELKQSADEIISHWNREQSQE